MRHSKLLVSLMVLSAVLLSSGAFGADLFSGTWKLNVAKSNPPQTPAPKQPLTQKIQATKSGMTLVQDSVNALGQTLHGEWTVKFDGKQYPVKEIINGKPDPNAEGETISATRIDDHTFEFDFSLKGKVFLKAKNVISADGKTRTAAQTRIDAEGKSTTRTVVYDKQ